VSQLWIQGGPPLPESFYIRIMFTGRDWATITSKMLWTIMRYQGRVGAVSSDFVGPGATKLGTAIAAAKIASMIEINFNVTRYNIVFVSGRVAYAIKIYGSPRFSAAVVSVTELAKIFHVPTVLTFFRSFAGQHAATLFLFVLSVVQGARCALNVFDVDAMQGRMIAGVVESCGQMQTDLLPFGQAQSWPQILFHLLGRAHESALVAFAHHQPSWRRITSISRVITP